MYKIVVHFAFELSLRATAVKNVFLRFLEGDSRKKWFLRFLEGDSRKLLDHMFGLHVINSLAFCV